MMNYVYWLIGSSVLFLILERVAPMRPAQPLARRGVLRDLGFVAFNGHFYSLLTASVSGATAAAVSSSLLGLGLRLEASPIGSWSFASQFMIFLVLSDFLQWCVHNLLHRVPWLWTFHKVHHSIEEMDWLGNWRFHWMESVVYRSLLWLPLALLGASPEAAFAVAVFSTLWGNFNHANLNAGLGLLGYVFNSPRMHLWHHDRSDEGGVAKNFGIVFSLWDFLFRTVFWPRDRSPERLGYPQIDEMPRSFLGEVFWPLRR
jgi:sterol desaturase/sphingolipid hydroxylase (fatty acid hydroxylase superfamily)